MRPIVRVFPGEEIHHDFVPPDDFYGFRAARMAARANEGRKMKQADNAPAFEDLDLDGDGNLSAEEFTEHHSKCPAAKPD